MCRCGWGSKTWVGAAGWLVGMWKNWMQTALRGALLDGKVGTALGSSLEPAVGRSTGLLLLFLFMV